MFSLGSGCNSFICLDDIKSIPCGCVNPVIFNKNLDDETNKHILYAEANEKWFNNKLSADNVDEIISLAKTNEMIDVIKRLKEILS